VVPDWGTLRFDLHVPNPTGGNLQVSIKGIESDDDWQSLGEIDILPAEDPDSSDFNKVGYYNYIDGEYVDPYTSYIDYGTKGFETFHLPWQNSQDILESLRVKPATLKFELNSDNSTVYLDDVFFQSTHLKLGNPSFARPLEDTHRENYLIENPQYSLSYNDAIKGPNWVSWQLNKAWLGDTDRPRREQAIAVGYPPTNFPPESVYSANIDDYPWLPDNALPNDWVKTASPDYRVSFGMDKGHMTPVENRTRTTKDIYSTFFTTNVLPQDSDANQFGAWRQFEKHSKSIVKDDNK
jgi:hypothetical protein